MENSSLKLIQALKRIKEKDKEVNVTFPDFPGCVAAGNDFKEALKSAQEPLLFSET
ncbi:MAG TPA: hypothetical protein DD381_12485 [Lentisphaeria bacterium]|nr:hypothetical protein [Lentisphaeria bacterium]